MHARELLELAALAALHGPAIAGSSQRLSESSIERYWTASKCRLDRWGHALKQHAERSAASAFALRAAPTTSIRAVLEEILTGEVLARVWCAVLTAHDRNHSAHQAEPIGRSVLIGHLEARHRTLRLLVNGPGIRADEALHLNRLRRRAERWTDLLIGNLGARFDVADLAPNPERAREFSHELLDHAAWDRQGQAWPVALVSIRSAFAELCSDGTSNHDLNAEIAHSIVGSFQPELFDSTGTLRSLWLMRLGAASSDVQGMIEDWLADDRPRRKRLPSSVPPSFERRRHP